MKQQLKIKTGFYIMLMVLGVLLSSVRSYANYVTVNYDSILTYEAEAKGESFDQALMTGLRELDNHRSQGSTGIIRIFINDCCVTAVVRMQDMIKADTMSTAEFVRHYVKFI